MHGFSRHVKIAVSNNRNVFPGQAHNSQDVSKFGVGSPPTKLTFLEPCLQSSILAARSFTSKAILIPDCWLIVPVLAVNTFKVASCKEYCVAGTLHLFPYA